MAAPRGYCADVYRAVITGEKKLQRRGSALGQLSALLETGKTRSKSLHRAWFTIARGTERMPSQNNETWRRVAAVLLSVPLAAYVIWQFGGDTRFGILFVVISVVLVVGFVVMLVVQLVKNRE